MMKLSEPSKGPAETLTFTAHNTSSWHCSGHQQEAMCKMLPGQRKEGNLKWGLKSRIDRQQRYKASSTLRTPRTLNPRPRGFGFNMDW